MQLQSPGQSYDGDWVNMSTNRPLHHDRYRGRSLDIVSEISDWTAPRKSMAYRGASYLGR